MQNEEEKTFDPNFWKDSKEAEKVMKSIRVKKKWVEDYNNAKSLFDDLDVIYEFNKEGEATDKEYIPPCYSISLGDILSNFHNRLITSGSRK